MRGPLLLLLLSACRPDGGLTVYDTPPEVAFTSPSDGTTVATGAWVTFTAALHDAQQPVGDLELVWQDSDGSTPAGTQTLLEEGVTYVVEGFEAGDRTITLTAVDQQGEEGHDSVTLHVVPDEAPVVSFVSPLEGDVVASEDGVRVEIQVTDADEPDLADLALAWNGAAEGTVAPAATDSAGSAAFYLDDLPAGTTEVSVTVTDSLGASATEVVRFDVVLADADGDGERDPAWGGEDCDDGDPAAHPGADELCDGADQDCDGEIDEDDAIDALTWYEDADGDGFGDAGSTRAACEQPSGWVADDTDCDDAATAVHPGATETCDGVDQDCDGDTDESGATGESTWYADTDGDGYGDPAATTDACDQPVGYVANATDCDDATASVSPAAGETCDRVDDDCDGTVDEDDAVDALVWYVDGDGDGAGGTTITHACDAPTGTTATSTDCDDGDAGVYPGADEYCDLEDDDCDGTVDEDDAVDAPTWYADVDGDGYGDVGTARACTQPSGFAAYDGDCDDTDVAYNPGATETDCSDPNDYNCDGSSGYADGDGDGWAACQECDDGSAAVSPDATEVCNSVDDDCDAVVDEDDAADAATWYADADADTYGDPGVVEVDCERPYGYVADDQDCDDTDGDENPSELETCDGDDDDCDGEVDEPSAVDAATWYVDADGDSFGSTSVTDVACDQPSGYVADGTDCDDGDADTYPGADEYCDGADDDCDGDPDEDSAVDVATWYADADGDAYGDASVFDVECYAPSGFVADEADCDDADADTHPAAAEVCDGEDDDCDGVADDAAVDAATWYADGDADTYGDAGVVTLSCSAPSGYVSNGDDCDDTDAGVSPADLEYCDGEDDDCDGTVDEDTAVDASAWYADTDRDTYGNAAVARVACSAPSGYVANDDDCDDTDSGVSPADAEVCDGEDDDCDGTIDDGAVDASTWYADADGDAYGNAAVSDMECTAPSGYVANDDDCDDTLATVSPADTEYCNTRDDDCDGTVDESDAADAATWYADMDGDGYGDPASARASCSAPTGYVANDDDCDDTRAASNPAATEYCNTHDDDCDGTVDEDAATDATTWYRDADSDGYGSPSLTHAACTAPSGYVASAGDCDDTRATVSPGDTEYCNSRDDDCDGTVDEDAAADATTWYRDADSDGYGSASVTHAACTVPTGYVATAGDCDDAVATVSPAGTELCNSRDDDCDGSTDEDSAADAVTWYRDADADTYGDIYSTHAACTRPTGYVSDSDDCDDTRAASNPGALESCNDHDDDCDGTVDENSATDAATWYLDADGDDFGSTTTAVACDAPTGYVAEGDDCDDADATIHPAAWEYCNGDDDDCDGTVDEDSADAPTWYRDADADGYGTSGTTDVQCSAPTGYVADHTDCNDASSAISPGDTEVCDTSDTDEDCDGLADDADPSTSAASKSTFYTDGDTDGYGGTTTSLRCDGDATHLSTSTDCNDSNAAVSPGDLEVCDALDTDENCDGTADPAGASGCTDYYADVDGDGYGDGTASCLCQSTGTYTADNADDCDDTSATVNPDASENESNGADDDCDGDVDEIPSEWTPNTDYDTAWLVQSWPGEGEYLSGGGDINGDGYPDLLSGHSTSTSGGTTQRGTVYSFRGNASGTLSPGGSLGGPVSGRLGPTAWIGDELGGDGKDEILAAAYNDANSSTSPTYDGRAYLVAGGSFGTGSGQTATSIATTIFYGAYSRDDFGIAVANAGDVFGDGYDDILISDATTTSTYTSKVYLWDGPPASGSVAWSTADVIFTADNAGDYAGISLDGKVDYDGDGFDDIVIGAPYDDTSTTDAGAVYIVLGGTLSSAFDLGASADVKITGAGTGDLLGRALDAGNDIDGDGYPDLFLGSATYSTTNTGRAWIYSGLPASGSVTSATTTFTFSSSSEGGGTDVALLGDVDGDGHDDVAVSSSTGNGHVYLYYGAWRRGTYTTADAGASFYASSSAEGYVGEELEGLDFDGDGLGDLALGNADGGSDVKLVRGDFDRLYITGAEATTIVGASSDPPALGYSLAAGDFNGDGYGDGVFGGTTIEAGGGGSMFLGPFTSPESTAYPDGQYGDTTSSDAFGTSMCAGDFDGDAFDDWILGGPTDDTTVGVDAGSIALYSGASLGYTRSLTALLSGERAGDKFGTSVATVGDGDGDGATEFVVGAPYHDIPAVDAGRAYVYESPATSTSTAVATLKGSATLDYFGYAVGGGGDVDGDGFDDFIVGAYGSDSAATDAGSAYLFTSYPTGTVTAATVADTIFRGAAASDAAGKAVAICGDVNGDGYDEVLLGAPGADANGADSGAVYLFLGPPAAGTLSTSSADEIIPGLAASSALGTTVAGVGDLDGDGLDEIAFSSGSVVGFRRGPVTTRSTFWWYQNASGDLLGTAIGPMGDTDGDGVLEMGIGAPGEDYGIVYVIQDHPVR